MNEELMIYESDEFEDSEQIEANPLVEIAKKVNEQMVDMNRALYLLDK